MIATVAELRYNLSMEKQYIIWCWYTYAYAEGITGRSTTYLMYDLGFQDRKEAQEWLKANRKRFKSKTTQPDRGYGKLGEFYSKPRICRKDKFEAHKEKYSPRYMHKWYVNKITEL